MKSILNSSSLTILAFLLILVLISAFRTNEPLMKEQAIQRAEQFVRDNGYTNLPGDKSKMSFELMDDGDQDKVMKRRENTLQSKAFCISEDKDSWDIGLLSSEVDITKLDSEQLQSNLSGRAVVVMKNSNEVRMAHKDPLFSHFEKLNK